MFIPIPQPARAAAVQTTARPPSLGAEMRQGLHIILDWKALMMISAIGILITAMGAGAFFFPEMMHIEEQAARRLVPKLMRC